MTRYIIIADGDGTRWGDYLGIPKQLAPIDGEPIIHRTVRLLRERGVPEHDIYIIGRDTRFAAAGVRLVPGQGYQDERGGAEKFLSSSFLWNPHGRTVVLYGDVFFTDEAMDTIVSYGTREWTLFARFGPHPHTNHRNSECFAQSFYPEHIPEHKEKLLYVRDLHRRGTIKRCGGWEHYHAMCGRTGRRVFLARPSAARNLGRAVEIRDWTDDFDKPAQYDAFVRARDHKVTVIIPYGGSCPHRREALSYTVNRWRSEYPKWPVFIGDCEGEWRKGVAIMRAAEEAQDGVLIIADADVWTPGIDQAVSLIHRGHPWVKPHRRFVRLTPEATREVLDGGDIEALGDRPQSWIEKPYRQTPCGGIVLMRRDVLFKYPPDPRFVGWGGEDTSWRDVLKGLVGRPGQGNLTAYHLWHPSKVEIHRARPSKRNSPLRLRYKRARANRPKLKELVAETHEAYRDS